MPSRTWWLLLGLLTVLSMARVAATHRVFSQIFDEPWHVAAGYEILTKGALDYDMDHPPLARVVAALPFMASPEPAATDPVGRGNELLLQNEEYRENLALARSGNLLFLALGIIGVALWGRHLFTPVVGLLAALLYALLPPILAHAGFATTDMAVAATLPLALYALTLFLAEEPKEPSWRRTLVLGVAVAAGLLSKFSFLVFFPAGAAVLVIVRRRFPFRRALAAAALAFLIVWAAYGFTFATLAQTDPRAVEMSRMIGLPAFAISVPMPAPAFVAGILHVKRHDVRGHEAFLLGEVREHGWWYYFPIVLFFKTPLPFLVLAIAGCVIAARRRKEVPLIAAAILAVAMTSHINIGIRHFLPIYAPLALCGALAIVEWRRLRFPAIALVLWLAIDSAAAHPDYLPWFNILARHPETILSDSNLDWGQDVIRLSETAQRLGIRQMTVSIFTTAPHDRLGLPPHVPLDLTRPVGGWLAISEMSIAYGRGRNPRFRTWFDTRMDGRPYRRVGKSIRLYDLGNVPP
jgi:dolichyl-phosphate-mannose-protein mannosyltransferase